MPNATIEARFKRYNTIQSELLNIRGIYSKTRQKLVDDFPGWDKCKDSRLTIFGKVLTSIDCTIIGIRQLPLMQKRVWWDTNCPGFSKETINQLIFDYDMYMKISFLHATFSAIESSMRHIYFKLNAKDVEPSRSSFKSIYCWLFNEANQKQSIPMFNLFRLTRNAVHNNGIHSSLEKVINLPANIPSKFVNGSKIQCDWNTTAYLLTEVCSHLDALVRDELVCIPESINDTFCRKRE